MMREPALDQWIARIVVDDRRAPEHVQAEAGLEVAIARDEHELL
jgi:hypothetical protein